jgi:hypothetical protein
MISKFILPVAATLAGFVLPVAAQTVSIDCGGYQDYTATDGTVWLADKYYTGGQQLYTGYNVAGTNDPKLYGTSRVGYYGNFSYAIPLSNGQYSVVLKFAETQYWVAGQRVFNVVLNGSTVLSNFDVVAQGGYFKAIDRPFSVAVTGGVLQISVQGVVNTGLLSAIQITPSGAPAPSGSVVVAPTTAALLPGQQVKFSASVGGNAGAAVNWSVSGGGSTPGSVDASGNYSAPASLSQAVTVSVTATSAADSTQSASAQVTVTPISNGSGGTSVVNIDCGGFSKYTGSDGTQWLADTYYTGGQQLYTGYGVAGANDSTIYQTSRVGYYGGFSYSIPVTNGQYNLTLRFADSQYWAVGQRVFNVAVNGVATLNNFDVVAQGGSSYKAVDRQFPITVTNGQVLLDFAAVVNTPLISAIQITPVGQPIGGTNTPVLQISSSSAQFSATLGGSNPAAQIINITNAGGGTLNWTAAKNQAWLSMSPASGTAPGGLILSAALAGLSAGTYTDTVTISAANAGASSPKTIAVTFTVGAVAPPSLTVSPAALSFSGTVGGANPAAQSVAIGNSGSGSFSWTASKTQSWLGLSAASGSSSATVSVSVSTASLIPGTYSDVVTVNGAGANGSPKTVAVTLTLTAAASPSPPSLTVTPTNISFNGVVSGGNPAAQMVSIGNSGSGSLAWVAGKTQSWLTLSASSGSAPGVISLGVVTSGLASGSYSDTVTISAAGASGSPKTVNVTLVMSTSTASDHYVSTSGSSSGDGSIGRPWDIVTALAGPSSVKPGDTIWLRGGTYGNGVGVFHSYLLGTAAAPIVVRQYPGERATIDNWLMVGCCDQNPHPSQGAYVWFWGLEFASTVTDRTGEPAGPPSYGQSTILDSVDTWAPGTKFINNIIHDTRMGPSMWKEAIGSEAYGNVVYNNGFQASDRGHGHGFYLQNDQPTMLIADNFSFNNFNMGLQAYGTSAAIVRNITLDGNVFFNNGIISAGKGIADNVILQWGGMSGMQLLNNHLYFTPELDLGYEQLGSGQSNADLVVKGNYFMGGFETVYVAGWSSMTFQNNTVLSLDKYDVALNSNSLSGFSWDNNSYYGSGGFLRNGNSTNFAGWPSYTGFDNHSTFKAGSPTGVWPFVRPNKYEPGRANILIYNWDMAATVSVDISSAGLAQGARFEVRDAQNFYGSPVLTGTYNGQPITLPMTGLTIAAPVGNVPSPAAHTDPRLGTFVILPIH